VSLLTDNGLPNSINERVIRATSVAAIEAYSASVGYVFSLNAGGRSGVFDVVAGDFVDELAADTLNGIYVGLSDDPTATNKVAKRRYNDPVSILWFGEALTSTINIVTSLGYKSVSIPNALSADESLQLKSETVIESGYCTIINNIPNNDPLFKYDSDISGTLRWFEIGDLVVLEGTGTGDTWDIKGMQNCKFGRIRTYRQKGGTISFAYFNEFVKIQLEQLKTPLVFTGVAGSSPSNFNTILNVSINNWETEGLVIENSLGNVIEVFNAETNDPVNGPALKLFNSSYNIISSFWSEATSTSDHPSLLIDGDSVSTNQRNIISHAPQILTANIGIKIRRSVGTRLYNVRFVGCSVGIFEEINSDLVIFSAQFDNCIKDYEFNSNNTIYAQTPNNIVGKVNTSHVVTSLDGGGFGYELRTETGRRYRVTAKSTYDVDVATGRGLVLKYIDNNAGDGSLLQVRHSINFFNAVSDSDCPLNTLFRSVVDGKLKYKDASGVINDLY
jgi:hypothetical protein